MKVLQHRSRGRPGIPKRLRLGALPDPRPPVEAGPE